jgi:hypothetical protein
MPKIGHTLDVCQQGRANQPAAGFNEPGGRGEVADDVGAREPSARNG